MSNGPDLSHFVQHRQLDVYAQSMARQGYAYGVDLRRFRWLASSTVGNAMVRAVDRAWPELSTRLASEAVLDATTTDVRLLRELGGHVDRLRAPLPAVHPLRPEQRGRWPLVTALGATRGSAMWLVLDVPNLLALEPATRAFLLGAGLGHLHCEHGVFFSAHLLASRDRQGPLRALRTALGPWTKVMIFSADRAGLLACTDLQAAIATIENPPVPVGDDPDPAWLPKPPTTAMRIRALEEFARSAVYARVVAAQARKRELNLRRLALELDKGPEPPAREAPQTEGAAATPPEPEPPHVPADAWSLARVDARLTARLKIL